MIFENSSLSFYPTCVDTGGLIRYRMFRLLNTVLANLFYTAPSVV
jgi:hypothetical protein